MDVIGVDCAAREEKTGLALYRFEKRNLAVLRRASSSESATEKESWIWLELPEREGDSGPCAT
jgi:hypothetical protein